MGHRSVHDDDTAGKIEVPLLLGSPHLSGWWHQTALCSRRRPSCPPADLGGVGACERCLSLKSWHSRWRRYYCRPPDQRHTTFPVSFLIISQSDHSRKRPFDTTIEPNPCSCGTTESISSFIALRQLLGTLDQGRHVAYYSTLALDSTSNGSVGIYINVKSHPCRQCV